MAPIIGTQTTRKCIGGPFDGRVVETPSTQTVMRVPNLHPLSTVIDWNPPETERDDWTTYQLCILRFPGARVEVWHPEGAAIAVTVARLAHCYVPESDLRLILAKVRMLETENERLRLCQSEFQDARF